VKRLLRISSQLLFAKGIYLAKTKKPEKVSVIKTLPVVFLLVVLSSNKYTFSCETLFFIVLYYTLFSNYVLTKFTTVSLRCSVKKTFCFSLFFPISQNSLFCSQVQSEKWSHLLQHTKEKKSTKIKSKTRDLFQL
jgi:hypothetical protein